MRDRPTTLSPRTLFSLVLLSVSSVCFCKTFFKDVAKEEDRENGEWNGTAQPPLFTAADVSTG